MPRLDHLQSGARQVLVRIERLRFAHSGLNRMLRRRRRRRRLRLAHRWSGRCFALAHRLGQQRLRRPRLGVLDHGRWRDFFAYLRRCHRVLLDPRFAVGGLLGPQLQLRMRLLFRFRQLLGLRLRPLIAAPLASLAMAIALAASRLAAFLLRLRCSFGELALGPRRLLRSLRPLALRPLAMRTSTLRAIAGGARPFSLQLALVASRPCIAALATLVALAPAVPLMPASAVIALARLPFAAGLCALRLRNSRRFLARCGRCRLRRCRRGRLRPRRLGFLRCQPPKKALDESGGRRHG